MNPDGNDATASSATIQRNHLSYKSRYLFYISCHLAKLNEMSMKQKPSQKKNHGVPIIRCRCVFVDRRCVDTRYRCMHMRVCGSYFLASLPAKNVCNSFMSSLSGNIINLVTQCHKHADKRSSSRQCASSGRGVAMRWWWCREMENRADDDTYTHAIYTLSASRHTISGANMVRTSQLINIFHWFMITELTTSQTNPADGMNVRTNETKKNLLHNNSPRI